MLVITRCGARLLLAAALALTFVHTVSQANAATVIIAQVPASAPRDPGVDAVRQKAAALTAAERQANEQLLLTAFNLFQKGEFGSARIGFERVIQVDPADAKAHYYLAETLVRLKEFAKARNHYRMVTALDPNSTEGLQAAFAMEKIDAQEKESRAAGGTQRGATRQTTADTQPQMSERFVDQGNGTILDRQTGLEWAQSDSGSNIDWNDAMSYCQSRGGAWRLPQVAELRGIYDDALATRCGGVTCGVPPSFRLTASWMWSSERDKSSRAWNVWLGTRRRVEYVVSDSLSRALCVRRP